jgi:hypothetical protein
MTAPNHASVLSYPSYEIQLFMSFLYCRASYEQTYYVLISEIRHEICWFRNFRPQWEYVKYVRVPT